MIYNIHVVNNGQGNILPLCISYFIQECLVQGNVFLMHFFLSKWTFSTNNGAIGKTVLQIILFVIQLVESEMPPAHFAPRVKLSSEGNCIYTYATTRALP
jgi:hypothetical protein